MRFLSLATAALLAATLAPLPAAAEAVNGCPNEALTPTDVHPTGSVFMDQAVQVRARFGITPQTGDTTTNFPWCYQGGTFKIDGQEVSFNVNGNGLRQSPPEADGFSTHWHLFTGLQTYSVGTHTVEVSMREGCCNSAGIAPSATVAWTFTVIEGSHGDLVKQSVGGIGTTVPAQRVDAGKIVVYDRAPNHVCVDAVIHTPDAPTTLPIACAPRSSLGPADSNVPRGETPFLLQSGNVTVSPLVSVHAYYLYDLDRVRNAQFSLLGGVVKAAPPSADDLAWYQGSSSDYYGIYLTFEIRNGAQVIAQKDFVIPKAGQMLGGFTDQSG